MMKWIFLAPCRLLEIPGASDVDKIIFRIAYIFARPIWIIMSLILISASIGIYYV